MGRELKKGDRVRVTVKSRLKDYLAGEAGEVITGPEFLRGDSRRYYLVVMHKGGKRLPAVFAEDEIEPDL
jgi:hypothetical protein